MHSIISYFMSGDYTSGFLFLLSSLFVILCCLPVHEYAHGLVAYKLGDDTAKLQGRLTLNPFAHLNLVGSIMILLFGIGYANPVPINPTKFRKVSMKTGMALTALAGPVSNLLMSAVSIVVTYILIFVEYKAGSTAFAEALITFFSYAATINVTLAVFNLFPIPPLDGSKVLGIVLPKKAYFNYLRYERYIMIVLLIVLFLGILDGPIAFISNWLFKVMCFVPQMILEALL